MGGRRRVTWFGVGGRADDFVEDERKKHGKEGRQQVGVAHGALRPGQPRKCEGALAGPNAVGGGQQRLADSKDRGHVSRNEKHSEERLCRVRPPQGLYRQPEHRRVADDGQQTFIAVIGSDQSEVVVDGKQGGDACGYDKGQ